MRRLAMVWFWACVRLGSGLQGQDFWQSMEGPPGGRCLHFTQDTLGRVFVVHSGVFRSDDQGEHWQTVSFQGSTGINDLLSSSRGYLFMAYGQLYRSTDGGYNWEGTPALSGFNIQELYEDVNGDLYAAADDSGFFRSADDGITWTRSGEELYGLSVFDVAGDEEGRLFVCTSSGAFRSTDGGQHWHYMENGLPADPAFDIEATTEQGIFAAMWYGLYRSTDGGESWFIASPLLATADVGAMVESKDGSFYIAVEETPVEGVFRTTDGGATWDTMNVGLVDKWVIDLFESYEGTLYLGCYYGGVFRSFDGGLKWEWKSDGIWNSRIRDMAFFANGRTLVSVTGVGVFSNESGIWGRLEAPYISGSLGPVWVVSNDTIFITESPQGLLRSTDSGMSWQVVNTGFGTPTSLLLAESRVLFAGNYTSIPTESIFRSSDMGTTWEVAGDGITAQFGIEDLATNGQGLLLASTRSGIFCSTNGGDHWYLTSFVYNRPHFCIAPNRNIYAANTYPTGIYRSTDNGQTWDSLPPPDPHPQHDIAVDLHGAIYVGHGNTVYRSTDDGQHWELHEMPYTGNTDVSILKISPDGYLYAGTNNRGLFRSISPVVGIDEPSITKPTLTLNQNYPNPFNASTTIEYSLPSAMEVNLEVYNILGQRVRTLKRGRTPAGEHRAVWDGRDDTGHAVSSGVYLIRMQTPTGQVVRKVMMIK